MQETICGGLGNGWWDDVLWIRVAALSIWNGSINDARWLDIINSEKKHGAIIIYLTRHNVFK